MPDIVLGDRYGASRRAGADARCAEARLRARRAFSLARNAPYAGGYTTMLYGRGAAGCHALQIEINRALYLDEDSIGAPRGFDAVQSAADPGADQTDARCDLSDRCGGDSLCRLAAE